MSPMSPVRPVTHLTYEGYPPMAEAALRRIWPELGQLKPDIVAQLETDARYAGYLERQEADIRAFRRDEALALPDTLDYDAVAGLSNEVREILKHARPESLGAAARLSGVTPAALTILLAHVKRRGPTPDPVGLSGSGEYAA